MLSTLITALVAAGTYTPTTVADSATVVGGKNPVQCYQASPALDLDVRGPARATLQLFVEVAPHAKNGRAKVTVALDGRGRPVGVIKSRGKLRYEAGNTAVVGPVNFQLPVPAGDHKVRVSYPAGVRGCVGVRGLELAAPAVVAQTEAAPPPVEPVPPPPPPPPASTEEAQPVPIAASTANEPAVVAVAEASPAEQPAEPVGTVSAAAEQPVDHAPAEGAPAPRLGPFIAGVLPRGDLKPATAFGLMLEVPFSAVGLPGTLRLGGMNVELMGHATAAVSPLRQQSGISIPDASTGIPPGDTSLIQRSFVVPLELGLTARVDIGWPLRPYAGIALASDIVRTQLEAYGRTYQQNDVSFGIAIRAGGYLPLGPGGLVAEVLYREVGSHLGPLATVGESTLAVFNLQVGYLFNL